MNMLWADVVEAHWIWLALALILATAEMLIAGFFLMWMALAAAIVGLLTWVLPLPMPVQITVFAVLSFVLVLIGRRYVRLHPSQSIDPLLNDRVGQLVGETVRVSQAIEGGVGRVLHGDSVWPAHGADAAVGVHLRVIGYDGMTLLVERL